MRYDAEHRGKTREKILKEAASAIRARGPEGVGVAALMKQAGLTHGGFYAHFGSKDALVAEAIGVMFEEARNRFDRDQAKTDPRAALDKYVGFYLSPRHRDARGRGCPVAALSGDMARLEPEARTRFGQGIAALSGWLGETLERHGVADAQLAGRSMLSELAGALLLSRAVADPAESDAILADSAAAIRTRYRLEAAQ
ncbi:TetR/AcrR family transcriptional repressor of nem operon [Sphingomonas kyeonggiensis]|uniref:TetR/AcrR family transcriptional regulator n=1 Tax=Sphingomonas kyeonggiensis TaxID=1268553 RepID=UPI0027864B1D|nr:TetR/AcrR family transcriptional regulator [Sphingomonas kyeonggiensis]MDQ0249406.1 TetR/AcrR family transcriptional repressor of nem operon [Sphingomonas kyeonggiensis]